MDDDTNVIIYVPAKRGYNDHPSGTAFAGKWDKASDDHLNIWYEEPDNFSNIVTFEDRLNYAAGRLRERYPTHKKFYPAKEDFVEVGVATYLKGTGWYMSDISDPDALSNWAGIVILGGSPELHQRRQSRQYTEQIKKIAKFKRT